MTTKHSSICVEEETCSEVSCSKLYTEDQEYFVFSDAVGYALLQMRMNPQLSGWSLVCVVALPNGYTSHVCSDGLTRSKPAIPQQQFLVHSAMQNTT
jgi:hypothetical protein